MRPDNDQREPVRARRAVVPLLRRETADANARPGVPVIPQVREALGILTDACGENLVAVVFFGSLLLGTSPTEESAADLFVVVDDYKRFYRDLGSRLPAARSASVMAGLNKMLPPNVIYLRNPGDLRAGAKCFVINRESFARGLSLDAPDHFCRGRLSQRVQVVYARSAEDAEAIERELETARRVALDWVPLYLPGAFDTLTFCFRMLEVSYRSEIRPEARSRVREVFEAQKTYFLLMFGRLLEEAVSTGALERSDGRYRLPKKPPVSTYLSWKYFFAKSKMRATLRWGKYMLTFEDWLDYIARKAERRTGVRLELNKSERRLPALLLWPKLFRVLRAMSTKEETRSGRKSNENSGSRIAK
jgi:predicted nucleotidyltransferase